MFVRGSVGAFGFWEWTGRFQARRSCDRDCRLADIFHLFQLGGEASLEVCAFVPLEVTRQEEESYNGWNIVSTTVFFCFEGNTYRRSLRRRR